MVVVPVVTPVTMPDDAPIVAVPVALLVHVPPAAVFDSRVVEPRQALKPAVEAVIAGGIAFTVTTLVAVQPPVPV